MKIIVGCVKTGIVTYAKKTKDFLLSSLHLYFPKYKWLLLLLCFVCVPTIIYYLVTTLGDVTNEQSLETVERRISQLERELKRIRIHVYDYLMRIPQSKFLTLTSGFPLEEVYMQIYPWNNGVVPESVAAFFEDLRNPLTASSLDTVAEPWRSCIQLIEVFCDLQEPSRGGLVSHMVYGIHPPDYYNHVHYKDLHSNGVVLMPDAIYDEVITYADKKKELASLIEQKQELELLIEQEKEQEAIKQRELEVIKFQELVLHCQQELEAKKEPKSVVNTTTLLIGGGLTIAAITCVFVFGLPTLPVAVAATSAASILNS